MNVYYLYRFSGDCYSIYYKSPVQVISDKSICLHEGLESYMDHALDFVRNMMIDQYGHVPTTTEPFIVIDDFPYVDLVDKALALYMSHYKG